MEEVIKKILATAIHAPSGDNSQPWKFYCKGLTVQLINLPDRDNPIFNYKQRGSYVAHGAVLTNIELLAKAYGYKSNTRLFPKEVDGNLVAEITLEPFGIQDDSLEITDLIRKRCTNRKKYFNRELTDIQKQELYKQVKDFGSGELILIEDNCKKQIVGKASSIAEQTMLEYRPLHEAFFSMIRWNLKEEEAQKGGMLADALELKPPQKIMFKWLSKWNSSKLLRKLGLPALISKQNAQIYASASAVSGILMENDSRENFVKTGMLFQKIWLTATKLGLSIQPIAGVLYLAQRVGDNEGADMPAYFKNRITTAVSNIYDSFGNPSSLITMVFRIGASDAPSAKSAKFTPIIIEGNLL